MTGVRPFTGKEGSFVEFEKLKGSSKVRKKTLSPKTENMENLGGLKINFDFEK